MTISAGTHQGKKKHYICCGETPKRKGKEKSLQLPTTSHIFFHNPKLTKPKVSERKNTNNIKKKKNTLNNT
jgi:hypothetical protein